jgi:FMN-dependent NADH-azoreductase
MMRTILHLTCSPRGPLAHSRTISGELVARLLTAYPAARVIERDLVALPPSFVDGGFATGILVTPPDFGMPALASSEALIAELEPCDAMVIGTPMNNYTVPATLKAWIDQIVRIHRTFRSTPQGKVGMLRDRPVYVVIASGGYFTGPSPSGTPAQPDFLTTYLRAIFGTIGIADLQFITLEGLSRGPEALAQGLEAGRGRIEALLPLGASA